VALTKSRAAITQVTATGQSTTLDLGASYRHSLYVRHVNGTGTISAQGTGVVECRTEGGSTWFTLSTFGFGTTASAASEFTVDLPDDAGDVRIDYTAPAGSTGHTLDAEVGLITAL
jgi:hypothetical protein